jgi:hypothetical protein
VNTVTDRVRALGTGDDDGNLPGEAGRMVVSAATYEPVGGSDGESTGGAACLVAAANRPPGRSGGL